MDTLIVGGIVVLALIVLVVALVMWLASPVDGETVTMTVDEALGREVASEQQDPHGHIDARQFYFDEIRRDWLPIGESDYKEQTVVDRRIEQGVGVSLPGK
jgi:hypothetical protein